MEPHELQEQTEHAHHSGQKAIGLTMAIVAVLLAIATLLGHRTHTEEVKLQTQVNDQWGFYQAKHSRAHEYGALAELAALLPNGHDVALKDLKISTDEECGQPPEKGCVSPVVKKSPILQQLVAETKGSAEHHGEKTEKDAAEAKPTPGPPESAEHAVEKHHEETGAREAASVPAKKIQEKAYEMERETQLIEHKSDLYDGSELFLEISIVLCSIALLAENRMYWKLSFISTAIGIGVVVWAAVIR